MQKLNNRKKHVSITLLIALTLFLTGSAASQGASNPENSNDLNVEVNVSQKTIIDIQPKSFAWGQGNTQVLPGSVAGPSQETSGYGRIQLENLGSVDIKQVWFNTSAPSQRPFGTGSASNYDSGNFINLNDRFVRRKEYGIDQPTGQDIIYLETPSEWDYGRFRNANREYFWTVNDEGADLDGAEFRVGIEPHNESQTGSTNLADTCNFGDEGGVSNSQCNGYSLSTATIDGTDYAFTDVEIGAQDSSNDALPGPDGGQVYCAVMNETQVMADGENPEVNFVKWDKGFPGTGTGDCGTATNMTVGGSSSVSSITPGDWINVDIRANIPYGVVADSLPTGNLYVLASS
jgi:hypothetical protein